MKTTSQQDLTEELVALEQYLPHQDPKGQCVTTDYVSVEFKDFVFHEQLTYFHIKPVMKHPVGHEREEDIATTCTVAVQQSANFNFLRLLCFKLHQACN